VQPTSRVIRGTAEQFLNHLAELQLGRVVTHYPAHPAPRLLLYWVLLSFATPVCCAAMSVTVAEQQSALAENILSSDLSVSVHLQLCDLFIVTACICMSSRTSSSVAAPCPSGLVSALLDKALARMQPLATWPWATSALMQQPQTLCIVLSSLEM